MRGFRTKAMPIQREFLDWKQPALAAAAEWLRARRQQPGQLDLSQTIVVVPGARAGRRLLEILVAVAEAGDLVLTPPQIVTEHALPELLYQPKLQFADPLTQQLAWVSALRSLSPQQLAPFLPHPPAPGDTPRWLAIAETLGTLHTELAADDLDCNDVLRQATAVEGFTEHDRWRVICELQRAYLDTLDRLKLWDRQTARLVAIKQREITTDRQIVLVGMADLNRAQRRMLDQIADRVSALIIAPRELSERFDEHGCVVPDQWTAAELPLADEQIERVNGPGDQAEAVTRWLAALDGRYRADQIAVGLPDERLAPQIERQLVQAGVAARYAIGKQLPETGPYRLIKIAADYAARRRFRDLAALVRHPDVFDWLISRLRSAGQLPEDLLTTLDEFASKRFPARLDDERLANDPKATGVLAIAGAMEQLVQPLIGEPQPLGAWAERLRNVLLAAYGERELDRNRPADRYVLAALQHVAAALDRLAGVPAALAPTVDVRQACRLALDGLSREGIAPAANPNAIELLGWLELSLDDAPALVVTSFNEGFVPKSTSGETFLPNRLRQSLGILHNDRRLARDAYALSVLLASRAELRLIVAHRDADGNPLPPSRLLFATDSHRLVARAQRFFGDFPPTPPRWNLLTPRGGLLRQSKLEPPRPRPLDKPLAELSVTKFRDYIACPYRFYLRHVLTLQTISDEAAELDGGAFGDLVHFVLEQFGRAEDAVDVRLSADPGRIVEYLDFQLGRITAARYGKHARPAVRVQIEQVRLRLKAFAEWQAARARDGWRIVFSEDSEDRQRTLTASFTVDDQPFTLRGRIDRIDYHDGLRRLSVLDYKTADSGAAPERTHRRADAWVDLQLPLYRHLLSAAQVDPAVLQSANIELGYVLLPRDLAAAGLAIAEWDRALLETADEQAREIVRAIRAERFWPPTLPPPEFADDVAVICHDHRLGSYRASGEGDAA